MSKELCIELLQVHLLARRHLANCVQSTSLFILILDNEIEGFMCRNCGLHVIVTPQCVVKIVILASFDEVTQRIRYNRSVHISEPDSTYVHVYKN